MGEPDNNNETPKSNPAKTGIFAWTSIIFAIIPIILIAPCSVFSFKISEILGIIVACFVLFICPLLGIIIGIVQFKAREFSERKENLAATGIILNIAVMFIVLMLCLIAA